MIRRFGWLTMVMALGLTLLLAVGRRQGTSPPGPLRPRWRLCPRPHTPAQNSVGGHRVEKVRVWPALSAE